MPDLKVDLAKYLESLDKRVYRVEQTVTSPEVMGGGEQTNEFDEVIIDGISLDSTPPLAPTGVTVTTGEFYDSIYADVEWTAPDSTDDPAAVSYWIELSEETDAGPPPTYLLLKFESTVGTNYRFENLKPNTTYLVRVTGRNVLGIGSNWSAGVEFTTGIDTTIPNQVTGITAGRGATSVVVTFDRNSEQDVDLGNGLYEIHLSSSATFAPGATYERAEITSSTVVAFTDVLAEQALYVRVRAIDSSGNEGPWSATVNVTAGGVIDSMVVGGLDAAKITFGTMSGNRIQANSMDVNRLTTSTLYSTSIYLGSGGQFVIGSPPSNGIYINSQGIRAYKASSLTFSLDVDGTATFSGNINGASMTASTATFGGISLAQSGMWVGTTPFQSYDSPYAINFVRNATQNKARIWCYSASDSYGGLLYIEAIGTFSVIYHHAGEHRWANQSGATTYFSCTSSNFAVNVGTTNVQNLNVNGTGGIYCGSASYIGGVDLTGGGISAPSFCSIGGVTITGGAIATTYIYNNTLNTNRYVTVNSSGLLGSYTSSIRVKKNVEKTTDDFDMVLARKVLEIEPVTFEFKNPDAKRREYGAIAEWVAETLGPELEQWLVFYDEDGRPDGVRYEAIGLALLPLIRKIAEKTGVLDG